MKIIDLLNKIANGEEAPKHIMVIFEDETDVPEYEWNEKEKMYKVMEGNFGWDENLHIYPDMLNYTVIPINKKMSNKYKQELINKSYYDEIEIIEEDKPTKSIDSEYFYTNDTRYNELIDEIALNRELIIELKKESDK